MSDIKKLRNVEMRNRRGEICAQKFPVFGVCMETKLDKLLVMFMLILSKLVHIDREVLMLPLEMLKLTSGNIISLTLSKVLIG